MAPSSAAAAAVAAASAARNTVHHSFRQLRSWACELPLLIWSSCLQSPNSPDLNPEDYTVWGALQEMVYHCRSFKSVQEVKSAIVTLWKQLSQRFLTEVSVNDGEASP